MTMTTLELSLPVALSLLSDLVGRKVTGQETDAVDLSDEDRFIRGVFVGDGQPAALYFMDVEIAAAIGAALVMMPARMVNVCVQEQSLPPMLVDNTYEVFNVGARLINRAGGVHYKLREQLLPGQSLPDDARDIVQVATQRTDLHLTVDGYGTGVLTILVR